MYSDTEIRVIRDRQIIEIFLRENTFIHLYSLGDLDDFFWPDTQWIALQSGNKIISVIMLYNDTRMPVLLAHNHRKTPLEIKNTPLLGSLLPTKLNAHVSVDFRDLLKREYHLTTSGLHYKMGLIDPTFVHNRETGDVKKLNSEDREELRWLYQESYPDNWFNERMLQTGHYYGIKINRRIVSVAGVHVFSEKYRVAALGNITTHPAYRNRGFAEEVTAHLCQQLFNRVDHIGLNVHSNNRSAIRCYQKLGFEIVGHYEECSLKRMD